MWFDLSGGGLAEGPELTLGAIIDFLEPFPYGKIPPRSALIQEKDLVLPQVGMSDIVDSPRKELPHSKE